MRISRAQAESVLHECSIGSFLIRPSSEQGVLTLSQKQAGSVLHSRIRVIAADHFVVYGVSCFGGLFFLKILSDVANLVGAAC